jgi:hypothetical protein
MAYSMVGMLWAMADILALFGVGVGVTVLLTDIQ